MFDRILVPQGAEATAVKRGLKRAQANTVILPIGMGSVATAQCLATALKLGEATEGSRIQRVLVMGVAGSLSPDLNVGDVVIYQNILPDSPPIDGLEQLSKASLLNSTLQSPHPCNQQCSLRLLKRLENARQVTAWSSDRLIHRAREKAQLHQDTGAEAVDMEAAAIAEFFAPHGVEITTVRVISDGFTTDLPDLTGTTKADGGFDTWRMAIAMLRQPRPALNLIRGSLQALKVLEQTTYEIFCQDLPPLEELLQ